MDIVTPPIKNLLEKVDSRYTLVVLGAKRARQLMEKKKLAPESLERYESANEVSNAFAELEKGKLSYKRTNGSVR